MPPGRPTLKASPHHSTSGPSQSSPRHPPEPSGGVAVHPKVVSFRRSSLDPPMEQIINEQSPLIRPRTSEEVDSLYKVVSPVESDDWQGDDEEETKSSFFLFLLTLGGLGLQIGWSVETSNGSVSKPRQAGREHHLPKHALTPESPIFCLSVSANPCLL